MFTKPANNSTVSLYPFPSFPAFSFQNQDGLFEGKHEFLKGFLGNPSKEAEDGRRVFAPCKLSIVALTPFHSLMAEL